MTSSEIEGYLEQGDDLEEEESEEEEEEYYPYIDILDAPRELPEPIDLTLEQIQQMQDELGLIKLCWPQIDSPKFEERTHFPKTYVENSDKEKLLLLYAENFRQQFCYKFPSRTTLFLSCRNEVGLQKMVCTTIRPTIMTFHEIETWDTCATFLANYVIYEPFDNPIVLPNRLYSPHTTLLRQSGQPQELATALCSLLLGLGYDAYVVFGYATQDVTLRIMTRVDAPYPPEDEAKEEADKGLDMQKYALKPPRDLRSKFVIMMEQRELDKVKEQEEKRAQFERERILKEETPPFDELEGQRFHFWVLIRTEGRQIDTTIFVEPSTGTAHPVDSKLYVWIESVWNNTNYWVNKQDRVKGLGSVDYNLHDVGKWEHFLVGEPQAWRETKVDLNMEDEEVALAKIMEEKHLDMPTGWSQRIIVPHSAMKKKFPSGSRKTYYKRTLIEEFAPYVQEDGLVVKITRYEDFECKKPLVVEQRFQHRMDKLLKIIHDIKSDIITEYFGPGREDAVLKHSYPRLSKIGSKRRIRVNHNARYDGLLKLEVDEENMVEQYVGRDDLFFYREVKYARRGHPPPGIIEGHRKIILDIVEKFERNPDLPVSEDIAVREFAVIDRQIHLKYHYGESKITASTRTFIKPPVADVGTSAKFYPELTTGFQAEIGAKPPRNLELYLLFQKMLAQEELSTIKIREIEDNVDEFLKLRQQEMAQPTLDVPLFNVEQNEEFRRGMLEKEEQEKQYREKEIEVEIDYLAPYLVKIKNISKMTYGQAMTIKNQCLTEYKQLLLKRARDIQHQFEYWTDYLKERQRWYNINQDTVTDEEETKYFQESNELNFLLQTYEIRLERHRDLSSIRYQSMAYYLDTHLKPLSASYP